MRSYLVFFFLVIFAPAFLVPPASAASKSGAGPVAGLMEPGLSPRVKALLDHRTLQVRNDGSSALQTARLAGDKAPASLNVIVMMCDFSDSLMFGRYGEIPGDFPAPRQSEIYYTAHDSIFFDHLFGDVADYFGDISDDAFTFNYTVHARVVNLPHPMGYFGDHPELGEQPLSLASQVIEQLDGEIDFSLFDTCILVHAGAGEETDILGNSPEQIYSNYMDPGEFQEAFEEGLLENPWIPSEDFDSHEGIDQVLILPECEYQDPVGGFGGYFGSLGVYCFEVGLRLGMLSLSDFTPSGSPDSQGIGEFGLMGYGLFVGMGWIPPHPCAFNKLLMGWLDPQSVDPLNSGRYFLTPCEDAADPEAALRVAISGQEYWLLAYRLQDPDGNRIFSFPGDLNGNNVPDFYDADSPWENGMPPLGGKFDPETDTRERLAGAEWDFFMSENSARKPEDKGAGSGIYIWHVDEGVVQDAFGLASNLFNADPHRKAVDLEEADGIQDLDSREPSVYMLGGDDDSFRREDNSVFGPDSVPNTATAGGARTGVLFRDISFVVQDSLFFVAGIDYGDDEASPPDTLWGFSYADTMFFELSLSPAAGQGPEIVARRELPAGVDLSGSHLLLADLDGSNTAPEIIVTGAEGEIFVFDGDLNEFIDGDGNPATVETFAVGTLSDAPVSWNQPASAGDFDGDGQLEIILTGSGGLYVFKADGEALQPDPGNVGLVVSAPACSLPPVLIPADREASFAVDHTVEACVVFQDSGEMHLRLYQGDPVALGFHFNLGAVQVLSAPVFAWGQLVVAVHDTVGGKSELLFCSIAPGQVPGSPEVARLDLPVRPGNFPVHVGYLDPADANGSERFAVIPGVEGLNQTVFFDGNFAETSEPVLWENGVDVESPVAPGGFFVGDGLLGKIGHNGTWDDGWPRRPRRSFESVSRPFAGSPLVAQMAGAEASTHHAFFSTRDGRIFAHGLNGEGEPGWPAAGPARCVGSPALGPVRGGAYADLVSLGTFNRITGLSQENPELETTSVSTLTVWSAVASVDPLWPMWGGSPWRNGSWDMTRLFESPVASSGAGLVPGSHICYPSPLGREALHVRARVNFDARVMVTIHNLEGEEVARSEWESVLSVDPFTVTLDLDDAASGMYLCRLVSETGNGQVENSVIPFAVVR